jgi:predicted metal-dependent hydrolase
LKRPRIEELDCPVEVRRHPAARRLTLRVSRTRRAVIVTLPVQCDLGEAGSFLSRNLDWVRERIDSLPKLVPFADGSLLPLRGEFHRIAFTGKRTQSGVVRRHRTPRLSELQVSGRTEHAARR